MPLKPVREVRKPSSYSPVDRATQCPSSDLRSVLIAVVWSRPESHLVIAGAGKRNLASDCRLIVVTGILKLGTRVIGQAGRFAMQALDDQHAYESVPDSSPVKPGDVLRLCISHQCAAFDKWRDASIVDSQGFTVRANHTFFWHAMRTRGENMARQAEKELVLEYYQAIDSQEIDHVVELFADDATYERPGYAPLVGVAAIEEFYRTERVIDSGVHSVSNLLVDGHKVAVEGEFIGRLRDGSDVTVRFADFFLVMSSRFARRHTYFFAPSV